MRASVFIDVLSHWCLVAVPAVQSLYDAGVDVEIVLAPIADGAPLGFTREQEEWFYRRGSGAYGVALKADWCEGPHVSSLPANAAVMAGAILGTDKWRLACAVMSEAMQGGALFGRPEVVYAFVAELLGVDADEVQRIAETDEVIDALRDGNRQLVKYGADERPTFRIENANGDFVLLKGLWQKEPLQACLRALKADEEAYAAAGRSPFS